MNLEINFSPDVGETWQRGIATHALKSNFNGIIVYCSNKTSVCQLKISRTC